MSCELTSCELLYFPTTPTRQHDNTSTGQHINNMNKIDIAYIVSHGFAARMVLQTGLLKKLVEQGKKVALITPDANDPNIKAVCEEANIALYEYEGSGKRWSNQYLRMRKYFLEDVEQNVALLEKHKRSKAENKGNLKRQSLVAFCYAMYKFNKVFPWIRKLFIRYEQKYINTPAAETFLKEVQPRLLVSTYPVSLTEGILLNAAQQLNIQTTIHLLSWDNISCKGRFPALADKYIAWGTVMSDEFQSYYGIEEKDIYHCGVPHFDAHIDVLKQPNIRPFIERLGLNPDKPYLFFAMSSPHFAPREIDIVEWLSEKIEANLFGDEMQFIIRPHPQNVTGSMADKTWLGRLDSLISHRVKVDYPQLVESNLQWSMKQSDMLRLSNMLAGASVCMNSGSTVSIDAFMVDTPVVLTVFDADEERDYWFSARRIADFPHMKKFLSFNGASVARNFDDLTKHLKNYIENPKANWEARQHTRYMECGENDGEATNRVCAAILDILGDTNQQVSVQIEKNSTLTNPVE